MRPTNQAEPARRRHAMARCVAVIFTVLMFAGCNRQAQNGQVGNMAFSEGERQAWRRLATKKIYFGHQSVGQNILSGVKDWLRDNPEIALRVIESRDAAEFQHAVFAHSRNGANGMPAKKISDFAHSIRNGIGGRADIAFFKLCYADFTPSTDTDELFVRYRGAMSALKREFPTTTFVHITVPLTVVQTGPKGWVKRLVGRPPGGAEENISRQRFNELMMAEYQGKEPVFDLARLESTLPDGSRRQWSSGVKTCYALFEGYTSDGGHLNARGRRLMAQEMAGFLAGL